MEKRHFLYKPHLFYKCHTQRPQEERFLAGRKADRTINRMRLTCSPLRHVFFPLVHFNTTFVQSLQKYLTGLHQAISHVSCCSAKFIGLPALDLQWWLTKKMSSPKTCCRVIIIFFHSLCHMFSCPFPSWVKEFIMFNEMCVMASENCKNRSGEWLKCLARVQPFSLSLIND